MGTVPAGTLPNVAGGNEDGPDLWRGIRGRSHKLGGPRPPPWWARQMPRAIDSATDCVHNVHTVKRIISRRRLREYADRYPAAGASLDHWEKVTLRADWRFPGRRQATFNDVDRVTVASGNAVYVFNIQGNVHRLVATIHTQVVYVLRLMTHREYDKGHWKDEL